MGNRTGLKRVHIIGGNNVMDYLQVKKLREHPGLIKAASGWFSGKWEIPEEAYIESMNACIKEPGGIPQWYIMTDEKGHLAAGAGIIENDFHDRRDLSPNLCALYVEEAYRGKGIARYLLDSVRSDAANLGIPKLYLVTDHTEFYEKCGWEFHTIVKCEGGEKLRMYTCFTGM